MIKLDRKLKTVKLIPVVSLPSVDAGPRLAEILLKHGFYAAEITFRTKHAAQGISEIKKRYPEMTILAGTVIFTDQADEAIAAGAEVMVSPGTEAAIIDYCNTLDVPIIPGVCTASEIQLALTKGVSTMKFFPAGLMGGVPALRTMLSVYRNISFMPTGGITPANVLDYLAVDRVVCCGATWLAPETMLEAGDWSAVTTRIKEASALLRSSINLP